QAKFLSIRVWPVSKYTNLLALLLPSVQETNITDRGMEEQNGQNLRHITVTLGNSAFNALSELGVVNSIRDTQGNELVKLENATLNLWIDEATSYIHHLTFTTGTSLDLISRLPRPRSSESPTSAQLDRAQDLTIDFSQFNQITSIPTPANAIPTTD